MTRNVIIGPEVPQQCLGRPKCSHFPWVSVPTGL